ncbi:hypothetical protein DRN72_00530 [Methanosarcinales archaeon]|nr:MAG: hypothetical protein DRN72_00530 [Methanosarcinales archaeon]
MLEKAKKIGKKLVERGYTDSFFGNISFKIGDKIWITKSGVPLDELEDESFVLLQNPPLSESSSESPTHIKIYQEFDVSSVIHVHPFYCILCSMIFQEDFVESRTEGRIFLKKIAFCEGKAGSWELANSVVQSLRRFDTTAVVARGHGLFCIGSSIDDAYLRCVVAENECKLWYHCNLFPP